MGVTTVLVTSVQPAHHCDTQIPWVTGSQSGTTEMSLASPTVLCASWTLGRYITSFVRVPLQKNLVFPCVLCDDYSRQIIETKLLY